MSDWFSPHNTDHRIGSLISVSATEALVNLTKAGTGEQKWLMGNKVAAGEVNEFLFIDAGRETILGRLVKVWLEGGERLSVDGLDDLLPSNNPIGLVQLLVSVDVESGKNYRGVKSYPRLGAQIYAAHPRLVSLLAEGKSNSPTNEIQMPIAELPRDQAVEVHVSPEKLFSRHCAVLGATGGGKSYTLANLVENVANFGGKALLIDATGEYSSLPFESYYVGENPNAAPQEKVTYPHWMFTESDIRTLLRPSAQSQAPKLDAAIQSLRVVTQYYQNPPQGLNISIPQYNLVKVSQQKLPFENAVQAISGFENNIPWSFSCLAEQIINECVWPNGGTAANPNTAVWGNRSDNDVGHCLNLISRVKGMAGNQNLRWMIDVDNNLLKIPDLIADLANYQGSRIIRLDLSAVPFEANAREILVNAIGRKILADARDGLISHQNPLLVFIDESHQFLNKKIGDESMRVDLDAFGNIAKEGRKYGLNITIATQRPRDIPEDVLSQIGTLIVHRLTNSMDQDTVKKAVGSIDNKSASFLPVLGQGEALLLGIDFPFPLTVKMKMPRHKPNSVSAEFSSSWQIQELLQ
jgi:hypothetical protein